MARDTEESFEDRVTWPATIGGWSQTFAVCDGRQALIERWQIEAVLIYGQSPPSWPLYIAEGAASKVRTTNWMEAVNA